ncbi:MAG: DUF1925 domain-containing protein, partial [Nitrososphaerota archaeon]|nr:DUF1925 domain-containing protein [Nitrososphaerota archaeon]
MNPIRFALAFHNHQPVGNADSIIEQIYRKSYLPFLKVLSSHPEISANLHYTGFLLEWFESRHPEFIDMLRELTRRGQIELLGGDYYEAILSVIPDRDALGQIEMLSRKLNSLFGKKPHGAWLAERAWEPALPELLQEAKITYTMVDDNLFESAGLSEQSCFEPYSVESRGSSVVVLPILRKLRYLIPFRSVDSTISFLKNSRSKGGILALCADDGEKFGAWPSTFDRVFRDGWLEKFFRAIEGAQKHGSITTIHISEQLGQTQTLRRTYLPSGSYPELREWALALESQTEKIAQGFFRQFLSKYPESGRLYSKMLQVSRLVRSVNDKQALVELWKGQCNDAYWHGIFGGLYTPLLRRNAFEHLIRAQVIAERMLHSGNWISTENTQSLLVINTQRLSIGISNENGGSLTHLDLKTKCVNILDTLAR